MNSLESMHGLMLPPPAKRSPVEWTALALGLLFGLGVGLSTVHGHASVRPSNAKTPISKEQESTVRPSGPVTSEMMRGAGRNVPLVTVADEQPKPSSSCKGPSKIPVVTRKPASAKPVSGARTLEFWNEINQIIAHEAEMRAPPSSITAANAGAFLKSRSSAARYAADALSKLGSRGVDGELVAHAAALAAWYRDELKVSDRGSFLLEKADVKTRKGAGGNQWKGSEEQHRKQCDELNARGAALRTKLAKKYQLDFPPML